MSSLSSSGGNHPPPHDGIINKTLFKCRKCKLLFWTTSEASAHERSCREPQWHNCAVCQVLRFRTREERSAHERTCPGARPLRMADLPLADRLGGGAAGDGAEGGAGGAAGTQPKEERQYDANRIGAIIDAYREQIKHGAGPASAAAGAAPAPAPAPPPAADDSDSSVEIIEPTTNRATAARCVPAPPPKSPPPKGNAPANAGAEKGGQKAPMEWTTVWTCDVCQKEQFDNYDEAVAHEKLCQARKDAEEKAKEAMPSQDPHPAAREGAAGTTASAPSTAKPSPSKESSPPNQPKPPSPTNPPSNEPVTLFSPVLRDASDSANFTQISRHHRLVLKSLRLLHLPPAGGGGGVSFRCQFCSHPFPPESPNERWTLHGVAEALPSAVMAHVTSGECPAATSEVRTQLPAAKLSGRMPFDEFLSGFFSENGIVERPGDGRGVVVLPDEEFQNMPG